MTTGIFLPRQGVTYTPCLLMGHVAGAPFSLHQTEEVNTTGEDLTIRSQIYRDSAGRIRVEWLVETHRWKQPSSNAAFPFICIDDPVTGLYAILFPSRKEAIIEPASIVATGVVPAGELQRKFAGPREFPLYVEYFARNSRHLIGNCFSSLGEPHPSLFTIPADYTVA